MIRVDAILITTIQTETVEQAEHFMQDLADGLAMTEGAPFTGLVDSLETDALGRRIFRLHPLAQNSECGGAEDGWHLNATECGI